MARQSFDIAGRLIGRDHPCFVIAEAGVNHNGDIGLAKKLIDIAAEVGADAVKFQTFSTEKLVCRSAPKAEYQEQRTGGESQYEMLKRLELSPDDHRTLIDHARKRGVLFMSTPFTEDDADLLDTLNVPVFKIPSGEITNLSYLQHIAAKGKPMIVSTGMATLGEVEAAVEAIEKAGNDRFVLLHCVSNYPADPADVNLKAMKTLATAFDTPVGYSDHTLGPEVAVGAVALGACVVEKHFTLDRSLPGPDHAASSEPEEMRELVRAIRKIESALGNGRKRPAASEQDTARVARKSLVAACDITAGTVLTDRHIAVKRPGTGLPPSLKPWLVGRKACRDIKPGDVLSLDMVA